MIGIQVDSKRFSESVGPRSPLSRKAPRPPSTPVKDTDGVTRFRHANETICIGVQVPPEDMTIRWVPLKEDPQVFTRLVPEG
jgi:hypothetical protein